MPECEGLPLISVTKTRGRAEPLQAAAAGGLVVALLLAAPCVAQVRRLANGRASASLDELARQPRSRESAAPVEREIYEPERAVRKRNALAEAAAPLPA